MHPQVDDNILVLDCGGGTVVSFSYYLTYPHSLVR